MAVARVIARYQGRVLGEIFTFFFVAGNILDTDKSKSVIVADTVNQLIRRISPEGTCDLGPN